MLLTLVLLSCVCELSCALVRRDTCRLGAEVYQVGDRWHPKLHPFQAEGCVNCTCLQGGEVKCQAVDCPKPDCDDPKYVQGMCCPVCEVVDERPGSDVTKVPGCTYFDTHYEDGARFPSNGTSLTPKYDQQCVLCDCFRGKVTCHVKTCLTDPNCIRTASVPDDCCPSCEEFVPDWEENVNGAMTGENNLIEFGDCLTPAGRKVNGTKWKPEVKHFGVMECVVCQCMNGHVSCSRVRCPAESALKCKRPQRRRGGCCRECHPGKRRRGRKNGGRKGEKKDGKKTDRKKRQKKGSGRNCKKADKAAEEGKERRKKGRRKRCKNKGKPGSKRKGKSKKRNGGAKKLIAVDPSKTDAAAISLDASVSDVIGSICFPKKTDRLVYLTQLDDVYSLAMDSVKENNIEHIQWDLKKGRIKHTHKQVLADPASFRRKVKVHSLVGAISKRHVKKFMKKLDRKQKKCKKKCRSKMLDRLFKRLKTKQLDLSKKCRV